MAKSARPCDAVGLQACTQADIDCEARKVKVILDYRGAYERELRLATSLYERHELGYPTEKTDPRLRWFSPDEFNLVLDGEWTGPDPEYTGGRSTTAPALRVSNISINFRGSTFVSIYSAYESGANAWSISVTIWTHQAQSPGSNGPSTRVATTRPKPISTLVTVFQ